MNANEREIVHQNKVYQIVGAAMAVSRTLGCGFLEAVYQEALEIELKSIDVPFEAQKPIRIYYKDQVLQKEYIADFLCYGSIIVEIKATRKITEIDEAQLLNYLKATKLPVGLIINFGSPKLEWKRYANTRSSQS